MQQGINLLGSEVKEDGICLGLFSDQPWTRPRCKVVDYKIWKALFIYVYVGVAMLVGKTALFTICYMIL